MNPPAAVLALLLAACAVPAKPAIQQCLIQPIQAVSEGVLLANMICQEAK